MSPSEHSFKILIILIVKWNWTIWLSTECFFWHIFAHFCFSKLVGNSSKEFHQKMVANCTNLDWKIISFAAKILKGKKQAENCARKTKKIRCKTNDKNYDKSGFSWTFTDLWLNCWKSMRERNWRRLFRIPDLRRAHFLF